MSLLNEMLNDLEKQRPKSRLEALPIDIGVSSQFLKQLRPVFFVLSCVVVLLFSFWMVRHHQRVESKVTASHIKAVIPRSVVASASAQTQVTSVDVDLLSYIASIPALAPLSEWPDLASTVRQEESLPQWSKVQATLPAAAVNKVYAKQSLQAWHDTQMSKAMQAIEEGDNERALVLLEAILVKLPQSVDARENLASLYLSQDDRAKASELINDGLNFVPHAIPLLTLKARLLLDAGQSEQALKLLLPYRPKIADEPDFYAMLATALEAEGRIREAGSVYKSLLALDPTNAQYWLGYAIALEYDHEINQAMDAYAHVGNSPDVDPAVRAYAEHRLKNMKG